jgi:hypothetical protein
VCVCVCVCVFGGVGGGSTHARSMSSAASVGHRSLSASAASYHTSASHAGDWRWPMTEISDTRARNSASVATKARDLSTCFSTRSGSLPLAVNWTALASAPPPYLAERGVFFCGEKEHRSSSVKSRHKRAEQPSKYDEQYYELRLN